MDFLNKIYEKLKTSNLFKKSFQYTFFNFIEKSISFFILPVLARYLTPADLGVASVFLSGLVIANIFIGLSVGGVVSVYYFKLEKDEFKSFLSNCYLSIVVGFALILSLIILNVSHIESFLKVSDGWIYSMAFASLGMCSCEILISLFRSKGQAKYFGIFSVGRIIMDTVLSFYFIIFLKMTWEGRILAYILTSIVFGAASFVGLIWTKNIIFKIQKKYLRSILNFGGPLIPHALGGFLLSTSDRFLINKFVGSAEAGLYSLGFNFGMILAFLTNSFNQAWPPYLFEKLKSADEAEKIKLVRFTYGYFALVIFLALLLWAAGSLYIHLFFDERYHRASLFVGFVAIGSALQGMYYMVGNYIFYVEKTQYLSAVTIIVGFAHFLSNYFLIQKYGAMASASIYVASMAIFFICVWSASAKLYPMPWFKKAVFLKNKSYTDQ